MSQRTLMASIGLAVAVSGTACSGSPAEPSRPPAATRVDPIQEFRVWTRSLETSFRVGATDEVFVSVLRASVGMFTNGCAGVTYRSSNDAVVSVSPTGAISARTPGRATISATCEGAVATRDLEVTAGIRVRFLASEAPPLGMTIRSATLTLLDGARAGETAVWAATAPIAFEDVMPPTRARVAAPGYEAVDVTIDDHAGSYYPQHNTQEIESRLRIVPEPGAEDVVGESRGTHLFPVRRPGRLTVRTWWERDFQQATFELRCGSQVLARASQHSGSAGDIAIDTHVEPCDVEVIVTGPASTPYRLRVRPPG
jgi:hypothetical protein